ncbi:MAG TPA: penicillin-binding protein activator [Thiolinea sp.]|mgnify:CR=1 FL=1|nr:penicillin-binding protein activator [Thiolinea sp.]
MTILNLRYSLSISLVSGLFMLQGCSLNPNALGGFGPNSTTSSATNGSTGRYSQNTTPTVELGNQLFKQGRKEEAADTYYRAALGLPSPQRERVLLQAAEVAASLGDDPTTKQYLKKIPRQALVGENQVRYRYTLALLALQNEQADQALRLLPSQAAPMTPGLRDKIMLVRERALEMGGTLPDANQIAQGVPPELEPAQQDRAPNQSSVLPRAAENLAVLLPNSGALGAVSKEIYQGMKDAGNRTGSVTTTRLYATTAANVLNQYQQAATEGADLIVGPLDKDALDVLLANSSSLTVPVLSLNYATDGQSSPALYQFGLSPEDEARQVAAVATQRGLRQALVLVPDSQWGNRLAEAFTAAYQSAGGQVVNSVAYPNSTTKNYLESLQTALTNSNGVQMVFLGASPTQARLMKPLLQAQAPDLPVYATSHVFSGKVEKSKDSDLEGIIYTEVPFVLQSLQQGSLDQLKYPRLYALGVDAVSVAKNLPGLVQNQHIQGYTGDISLGQNRLLQRRLTMATFKDGLPTPLE